MNFFVCGGIAGGERTISSQGGSAMPVSGSKTTAYLPIISSSSTTMGSARSSDTITQHRRLKRRELIHVSFARRFRTMGDFVACGNGRMNRPRRSVDVCACVRDSEREDGGKSFSTGENGGRVTDREREDRSVEKARTYGSR